jgi:hypothetical protein
MSPIWLKFRAIKGSTRIQSVPAPRHASHVMRIADMIDWCDRSFCALAPLANVRSFICICSSSRARAHNSHTRHKGRAGARP